MSQYQQQFQQANTLLWQKDGSEPPDAEMMAFLAGDDVVLDRQLFLYDVEATKAHIGGLGRITVLTSDEVDSLRLCLDDLAQRYQRGEYILDVSFEDSHSAIEAFVTQQLGEVGQKFHTGRSRNDQVLVATRLYLKQQ
ncbi:MAG: argininosuccinate lyase, partial [Xanthomonadales bacterium]|nr:argininosuccinate lyase [Xanthomonadales bacterium]